jgi:hypothetical protein
MSSAQEENRKHKATPAPASATDTDAATIEADLVAGGNLDKIRTILFGAQSRDIDRRFAKLEETLAREAADIRDTARNRFDVLEDRLKRELESLGDRLKAEENERAAAIRDLTNSLKDATRSLTERIKTEQTERTDAVTELTGDLRNTAGAIDRRIAALDEQTAKADREARDMLAEQGRRLSDDLRNKSEEIWAALAKAVQELRNEKTDRSALAALLTEVAMRLNDEFKLPSGE